MGPIVPLNREIQIVPQLTQIVLLDLGLNRVWLSPQCPLGIRCIALLLLPPLRRLSTTRIRLTVSSTTHDSVASMPCAATRPRAHYVIQLPVYPPQASPVVLFLPQV